jgi:hypothetical protein
VSLPANGSSYLRSHKAQLPEMPEWRNEQLVKKKKKAMWSGGMGAVAAVNGASFFIKFCQQDKAPCGVA